MLFCAIITRGLYTFYPIFEGRNVFLRSCFRKTLTLCMVSIQERFLIKSRFSGAHTVYMTRLIVSQKTCALEFELRVIT